VAGREGGDHQDDLDDHGRSGGNLRSNGDLHGEQLEPGEAVTRSNGTAGGGVVGHQARRGGRHTTPLRSWATSLGNAATLAKARNHQPWGRPLQLVVELRPQTNPAVRAPDLIFTDVGRGQAGDGLTRRCLGGDAASTGHTKL
jgi:hypothetical protein